MNIKFIGKNIESGEEGYISFWGDRTKFSFEITWNEKTEDALIFEKELGLNLENQLSDYFGFERDDAKDEESEK